MKKIFSIVLLFIAVTAFAQQQSTPNPITGTSRTPLEKKGYDDAMREVEQAKQKAEADKKKADADAEAKRQSAFITDSAVDVAIREEMASANHKKVERDRKLIRRMQKLAIEMQAIQKELEADGKVAVEVHKVAPK